MNTIVKRAMLVSGIIMILSSITWLDDLSGLPYDFKWNIVNSHWYVLFFVGLSFVLVSIPKDNSMNHNAKLSRMASDLKKVQEIQEKILQGLAEQEAKIEDLS